MISFTFGVLRLPYKVNLSDIFYEWNLSLGHDPFSSKLYRNVSDFYKSSEKNC